MPSHLAPVPRSVLERIETPRANALAARFLRRSFSESSPLIVLDHCADVCRHVLLVHGVGGWYMGERLARLGSRGGQCHIVS